MSVRKDTKQRLFATLSALAVLCVFSSCASSTTDAAKTADTAASDSATLLDDSTNKVGATDVSDSSAFSDLDSAKDQAKKDDATGTTASAPAADGETYYNPVGGESLRRVAFTLYSDKSFAKKLLEKNPDLKGVKRLAAEQKVYFDMDSVRPEPRFLTKDLLDRYSGPLAEKVESQAKEKGLAETTATLNKGESLQDLSQRLYGTHRYWTEIYLFNHDKIKNYDKVPAGLTLAVVNRPNTGGVAKAEAPAAAPPAETLATVEETPTPPAKAEKPAPVVAPVAVVTPTQSESVNTQPAEPVAKEAPKDPVPEIPPVAEKAPEPPVVEAKPLPPPEPKPLPIAEAPKPIPAATQIDAPEQGSANSNLRRILYVVLILGIGGAAFYFTRTPKRPKVDMLDLNASVGDRPKLAPKDNQQSNIG